MEGEIMKCGVHFEHVAFHLDLRQLFLLCQIISGYGLDIAEETSKDVIWKYIHRLLIVNILIVLFQIEQSSLSLVMFNVQRPHTMTTLPLIS